MNDKIEVQGIVTKVIKGGSFEITIKDNKGEEHIVTARPSGKLVTNKLKILINDEVTVGISPYDPTRGIIVWRGKKR